MTDPRADKKLALIKALTREELAGWRAALARGYRPPHDGELAALAAREQQIGEGDT